MTPLADICSCFKQIKKKKLMCQVNVSRFKQVYVFVLENNIKALRMNSTFTLDTDSRRHGVTEQLMMMNAVCSGGL